MPSRDLVMFATNDLTAVSRGRAFPAADLAERRRSGVGWVPANLALTPFGPIAADNPFGPMGDLRLLPDDAAGDGVRMAGFDGEPELRVFLCDIRETDGRPWPGCGRTLLKQALADLEREAGLALAAAFEHEFLLTGQGSAAPQAFSLADLRGAQRFAGALVEALQVAGAEPENILPEYGPRQFEVTCRPAVGVAAADRAVVLRDVTRDVARQHGLRASFVPIADPAAVGNGVHVHFSLRDRDGRPAMAGDGPCGLSAAAGSFVAGVQRHMPALCAVTAPSVISYLRLTPHRWSAGYNAFGLRNREAALRIPPVNDAPGSDTAAQLHLEYRPGDATASPYLALGFLVRAGLQGLREKLPAPQPVERDPADLDAAALAKLGVRRLPGSLPAALAAFEADATALAWMPEPMRGAYFALKRAEMAMVAELDDAARCARYAEIY